MIDTISQLCTDKFSFLYGSTLCSTINIFLSWGYYHTRYTQINKSICSIIEIIYIYIYISM